MRWKVKGQRKKGRLKRIWKKQVVEEDVKVGLRRKDALCRSKWSAGINQIAAGLRCIWPPSLDVGYNQIVNIGVSLC